MPLTNLLNPPSGTAPWEQFQRGLANKITDTICANQGVIYAGSALAVVASEGGAAPIAIPAALWVNHLCSTHNSTPENKANLPGPGYTGGQCVCQRYLVNVSYEFQDGGGWYTNYDTINSAAGPIQRAFISNNGLYITCRGFSFNCGELGDYAYLNPGSQQRRNFQITSVISANPNQPDNCGNPAPTPPPNATTGPTTVNNVTIPVTFADGSVNIPITIGSIQPHFNFGPIVIPVTINNSPTYIDTDYNVQQGPPPGLKSPDPKPSEDSDFPPEDECCDELTESMECVREHVCTPFNYGLIQSYCDPDKEDNVSQGSGVGFQGISIMLQAMDIFNDIRAKQFCSIGVDPVPPSAIGSGTSSEASPISILSIDKDVVSVILIITGYDQRRINITRLAPDDREEGKFGSISSGLQELDGVFEEPSYVWSSGTYHKCVESSLNRQVKISLRPTVQWTLYDSGERSNGRQ